MEASPEARLLDRFDECIRESIPVVGEFILDKHLNDMGLNREEFTLDHAESLIEKVIRAVKFCAGADKARKLKGEFRRSLRETETGVKR